jgi:hypothetical protein
MGALVTDGGRFTCRKRSSKSCADPINAPDGKMRSTAPAKSRFNDFFQPVRLLRIAFYRPRGNASEMLLKSLFFTKYRFILPISVQ